MQDVKAARTFSRTALIDRASVTKVNLNCGAEES